MHISHNTFLKWKQIPLQPFSRALSPSLSLSLPQLKTFLRFSSRPPPIPPPPPLQLSSPARIFFSHLQGSRLLSVTDGWSPADETVVLWVVCHHSDLNYVTQHDSDMLRPHKVPQCRALVLLRYFFLLMQVAKTASESVWGTRLVHVGMLFNRLSDQSAHQLVTRPLCKLIWPGGKG